MTEPLEDAIAVERVTSWMTSLLRAVRATRLYPADSPARAQNVDAAHLESDQLLRDLGTITLIVRDRTVCWRGQVVYEAPDRDPFAHVLYASAVFEVSFDPGLSAIELASFFDALASEEAANRVPGESLVTALWKRGLEHIRYRYFEILRLARSEKESAYFTDLLSDDEAARLRERIGRIADRLGETGEGEREMSAQAAYGELESPLRLARVMLEKSLKPGSILRLHHELARRDPRDVVAHRLAVLLIRALVIDPECAPASAPSVLLRRLLEEMVAGARFEHAARVLTYLRASAVGPVAVVANTIACELAQLDHVERAFRALTSMDRVERGAALLKLCVYLRALGPIVLDSLLVYARSAADDPSSIPPLAAVIADLSKPDATLLASNLSLFGADLSLELLSLVRAWTVERAEVVLFSGLSHPNPRVRVFALSVVAASRHPATERRIAQAIHDVDPSVRRAALRHAAAGRLGGACREIHETMKNRELFAARDPHEIRLFFEALVLIEGPSSLPVLERFLHAGGLRLKATHVQLGAAHALARLDHPQARALLERGAHSIKLGVRNACRRALQQQHEFPAPTPLPELAPVEEENVRTVHNIRGRLHLLEATPKKRSTSNGGE